MSKLKALFFSCYLIALTFMSSHAQALEAFDKRFNLVKDSKGAVVKIVDMTLLKPWKIKDYLTFLQKNLVNEQQLMKSKADYEYEVRDLLSSDDSFKGMSSRKQRKHIDRIVKSLRKIEQLDIEKIFKNRKFKKIMKKLEKRLRKGVDILNPSIVANLENKKYFYSKALSYQAFSWALKMVKSSFATVPVVNTATYVIVQVRNLLDKRRKFHQNMLLHYLENHDASELGMTKLEVDRAFSSIYESRIPWYAFWESRKAKNLWHRYGLDLFYTSVRTANNRLRRENDNQFELTKRLNYSFQEVVENQERKVINLYRNESMINKSFALAYNFDRPNQVRRKRVILQLAQLGVSFLSLPNFIKSNVQRYIKSQYAEQMIDEGALVGYLENHNNNELKEQILKQYLNPFDPIFQD